MYPVKFTIMNERLVAFLQAEQLSPARFAELMNIQRSGVSHLLSGRNKPGYDFIEKFLHKFPAINIEWLISGRGKMYKEQQNSTLFSEQQVSAPLVSIPEEQPAIAPEEVRESPFIPPLKSSKQIDKVILIYTDGTFEHYSLQ